MIDRNFCVGNQVSAVMSLVCWNYLTILQLLHGWADPKTGNLFYLCFQRISPSFIWHINLFMHPFLSYILIILLIVFYLALNFIGEIDSHTCEHRSVAWSLLIITPNWWQPMTSVGSRDRTSVTQRALMACTIVVTSSNEAEWGDRPP